MVAKNDYNVVNNSGAIKCCWFFVLWVCNMVETVYPLHIL